MIVVKESTYAKATVDETRNHKPQTINVPPKAELRNRVIPASAPGMTAANAFYSQPKTLKYSVLLKSFHGIV
jgi:hypothetical protein